MKCAFSLRVVGTLVALALATAHAGDKITSKYTSTAEKDAKVLADSSKEPDVQGDYFRHLCPGLGGYQIIHEGGDARSWVNVKIGDKVSDLYGPTMEAFPAAFIAKANDVIEWRGVLEGDAFKPFAIIYRLLGAHPETGAELPSVLLVIKLDGEKSRVVGVASGKSQGEDARAIADRNR